MDEMIARRNGHEILGPNVLIGRRIAPVSEMESVKRAWNISPPSQVAGRSLSSRTDSSSSSKATCSSSDASNTCEKPMGSNVATEITVAVVIPIALIFICTLIYLHRRNVKRQRQEDGDPHHRSLDFGLEGAVPEKSKRKSKLGLGGAKPSHTRGLSLDMDLSSPYLLPDHVQGSRESMHSLAKTLQQPGTDDPYRPVAFMSETGSIRSLEKGGRYSPSVMTASTKRQSRQSYASGHPAIQPLRQNSYPKVSSPLTPSAASSMTAVESDPSSPLAKEPTVPELGPMPPPQGGLPPIPTIPEIRQPAPVAQRGAAEPMHMQQQDLDQDLPDFSNTNSKRESADELGMRAGGNSNTAADLGLGLLNGPQSAKETVPATPEINVGPGHQSVSGVIEHTEDYADFDYAALITSPADEADEADEDGRGRSRVRESGLMVPGQQNKRLSVGLRPLPPSEVTEHEDPETRANRIRSFYKEYFDDSKPPPMPSADGRDAQFAPDNYMGDAAYFDPDSNQFIMPYAQPIGRRAMTPPPSGSRFPGGPRPGPRGSGGPGPRGPGMPHGRPMGPGGPRGPPRQHSGSIGGMSAMSYGPRPDSSASARGPRSGSAMSGKPRKPLPPPSPLTTLPTPSQLSDDHFALINAADFAPPPTHQDRARGRSQSPMGERRNYAPQLPSASPLVGTFDEMAALPSPAMLRKSGTFTGLDFAPPKRIKDSDSMSDAGSIRSNRSGVSKMNEFAIRSGAGRVSRLPGDIIFSQAQMGDSLKPTFNMNNNY